MDLEIQKVLDELKNAFVLVMKKINLDSSNLVRRTKFIYNEQTQSVTVLMPDYSVYIDKGRKRGKRPPVDEIKQWIIDKNINPVKISVDDLAWAISYSIGKKGTKAKPFLINVQKEITKLLTLYINEKVYEVLNETLHNKK